MEGVKADLHPEGVVHRLEAFLLLHKVEAIEMNGTAVLHLLLDLRGVILEVLQLSLLVVRRQADRLGGDGRAELRRGSGAVSGLDTADIIYPIPPPGQGGKGRRLHDLLGNGVGGEGGGRDDEGPGARRGDEGRRRRGGGD